MLCYLNSEHRTLMLRRCDKKSKGGQVYKKTEILKKMGFAVNELLFFPHCFLLPNQLEVVSIRDNGQWKWLLVVFPQ